jgi:transposase
MAPKLANSQHVMIRDMIQSGSLSTTDMAKAAGCSCRAIKRIRSNLRCFGTTGAPPNRRGRHQLITPPMLDALCENLVEKPNLYLDKMMLFLWDEFEVHVTKSTISRALALAQWSKKVAHQVAKQRNSDLRDFYLHNLSSFQSFQLVYVDESGCDQRIGIRRTGWSPVGTTPIQIAKFQRERQYQILPAYTQEGILLSRVFQGATDGHLFEDFIEQLLVHCGRWPEPNSVLIMDNASFHRSERIEQMCADAGVKLLYLPPYSSDLNPIEEFFCRTQGVH